MLGSEVAGMSKSYLGIYTSSGVCVQNEDGSFSDFIVTDPTGWNIVVFKVSAGVLSFYLNGVFVGTAATPLTGSFRTAAVGGRIGSGERLDNDLASLLPYSAALSDANRITVENELAAYFGLTIAAVAEVTKVVTIDDVSASLQEDRFELSDAGGRVGVWFNNGGGSAPGGYSRTIAVPFMDDDDDSVIAANLITALNSDGAWTAVEGDNPNEVIITDDVVGLRTDAADVSTGFAVSVTTQGRDQIN